MNSGAIMPFRVLLSWTKIFIAVWIHHWMCSTLGGVVILDKAVQAVQAAGAVSPKEEFVAYHNILHRNILLTLAWFLGFFFPVSIGPLR
jgi:hypothetical protein